MSDSTAYVPGVCNINNEEISKRRKVGHIGLAVFLVVLIALLLISVTRYSRIILFFPAYLSATGYLQAKNKFCVGYGRAGLQNADPGSVKASQVTESDAIAADKRRTQQMNLEAALIAIVATALTLAIPHI
jgi:hypothetical protein